MHSICLFIQSMLPCIETPFVDMFPCVETFWSKIHPIASCMDKKHMLTLSGLLKKQHKGTWTVLVYSDKFSLYGIFEIVQSKISKSQKFAEKVFFCYFFVGLIFTLFWFFCLLKFKCAIIKCSFSFYPKLKCDIPLNAPDPSVGVFKG